MLRALSSRSAHHASTTLPRRPGGRSHSALASCWVIVLAPCAALPAWMFATMARQIPSGSRPRWSENRWSSAARVARTTCDEWRSRHMPKPRAAVVRSANTTPWRSRNWTPPCLAGNSRGLESRIPTIVSDNAARPRPTAASRASRSRRIATGQLAWLTGPWPTTNRPWEVRPKVSGRYISSTVAAGFA